MFIFSPPQVSDIASSNKTKVRSENEHGSQTDKDALSSSQLVKDEPLDDENIDVIGISDTENDSVLEDLLALTPIQCPIADKKMQMKKNKSTTVKKKINQLCWSNSNKKVLSDSKIDNINQSQDAKASKKKKTRIMKDKKENILSAVKVTKSSQCQSLKGSKKKSNVQVFSVKKKALSSDCSGTKTSKLTKVQPKTKKITKSSSNSSPKRVRNNSLQNVLKCSCRLVN